MASTPSRCEAAAREDLVHPGRLLYLENHTFRGRDPAIIGVGSSAARTSASVMRPDGSQVGQVKSFERGGEDVREANQGDGRASRPHGRTPHQGGR